MNEPWDWQWFSAVAIVAMAIGALIRQAVRDWKKPEEQACGGGKCDGCGSSGNGTQELVQLDLSTTDSPNGKPH